MHARQFSHMKRVHLLQARPHAQNGAWLYLSVCLSVPAPFLSPQTSAAGLGRSFSFLVNEKLLHFVPWAGAAASGHVTAWLAWEFWKRERKKRRVKEREKKGRVMQLGTTRSWASFQASSRITPYRISSAKHPDSEFFALVWGWRGRQWIKRGKQCLGFQVFPHSSFSLELKKNMVNPKGDINSLLQLLYWPPFERYKIIRYKKT